MAVPVAGPGTDPPESATLALARALADGRPHAEAALARATGLAPAAVRAGLAELAAAGLDAEAEPDGRRLAAPLDWMDAATVLRRVPAAFRSRIGGIENHWRLDSTQSECRRRAADLPDRSFVFADWQLAGRGRRGRQWVSPPATNLQGSCFARFRAGYASLAGLSLAVGVALVEALSDCGVAGVALKWPNDLVWRDAKLGGVLVELGGDAMGACHAIVGVGINVRVSARVRRALERPCADLVEIAGSAAPSRDALAAAVVARLVAALDAFSGRGFAAFAEAWARLDALAGRTVRVTGAQGMFEGVAAGADAHGALRVRVGDEVRCIDSGEVTVRIR